MSQNGKQSMNDWIEVGKKLPAEGIKVLTFNVCEDKYNIDYIIQFEDDTTMWACTLHREQDKVTHWMPLPRSPTEF